MVTMTDVARAVGVSIQTVSAVINDKPGISEPTRQRVLSAIAELGYHPNGLASSLRSQRSVTIGVLVANIVNPFYPGIVRGIEDVAQRNGYSIFLCNTDEDTDKYLTYLQLLRRHRVAGLISVTGPWPPDSRRIVEQLVAQGVPVVLVESESVEPVVTIKVDNQLGEYFATQHLIDLGHRRIGFSAGPSQHPSAQARRVGYVQALRDRGIPFDAALIVHDNADVATGQESGHYMMKLETPPTAIVASNDLVAIGIITTLKRLGKRVPKDVSVVGFDGIEMGNLCDPPLTTVAQPLYEMGVYAMTAVLDRIHDPTLQGTHTIFDPQLIVRQSTAMIASAGRASSNRRSPDGKQTSLQLQISR